MSTKSVVLLASYPHIIISDKLDTQHQYCPVFIFLSIGLHLRNKKVFGTM
jgi:hypothetical protein